MATKKKTTTKAAAKPEEKKAAPAPEKKTEATPAAEPTAKKEVKKETAPKKLTLRDIEKLEASAEKLILEEDFKKVSELSDAPGLLISGFRDVQGKLKLRVKYEVDGEVIVNKLRDVHHL